MTYALCKSYKSRPNVWTCSMYKVEDPIGGTGTWYELLQFNQLSLPCVHYPNWISLA